MKKYDHKKIEKKWQKIWDAKNIYKVKITGSKKKKFYSLVEFPFPSGEGLHVGHVRSYTAMDIISRLKRAQGYEVLYPMGWDAFGLPTENYALKTGLSPKTVTKKNSDNFRRQLKSMGLSFDWSREINTTDPEYYKWTQWIFLQMYKKGLAYKARFPINWCASCKIGLANEEAAGGRCERCGGGTDKREKEQWMLAITKYADRLDKDLDTVDFLPRIKTEQRNWIGRSDGMLFTSPVKDSDLKIETFNAHFEAFAADTFLAIAPDHPLLLNLLDGVSNRNEILDKCAEIIKRREEVTYDTEKEMDGIFTGRYVVDPVGNGDLPIWVASFALVNYGTGVVKCSAHDKRDFAFAKKFNIPLKAVLFPQNPNDCASVESLEYCFSDTQDGILIEPAEFKGKRAGDYRKEIISYLKEKKLATPKSNYRLRDWVFSRQRYWGEPIPMIHCEKCGTVPVPEKDLPVLLPEVKKYQPTDTGESPLADISKWVNVKCPVCKSPAKRETDTMPNWAGSSWYFLRYLDPKNKKTFADQKIIKKWMPVDWYNGGMEHTTLHVLYSRFWHKFLYDQKLVSTPEPYKKRTSHGMILARDGQKMSKSRGNVVNPDEVVKLLGADTLRIYEMFLGPFDQEVVWNTDNVAGPRRFLEHVWDLAQKVNFQTTDKKVAKDNNLEAIIHSSIKKITEDILNLKMNTAVSQMMILLNELEKFENISRENYEIFLRLLAPFAPHITEELWQVIGNKKSIHLEKWPKYDKRKDAAKLVTIAIQVNGKMRTTLDVLADTKEEDIAKKALSLETISKWLDNGAYKKAIYVQNKVLNFVV